MCFKTKIVKQKQNSIKIYIVLFNNFIITKLTISKNFIQKSLILIKT